MALRARILRGPVPLVTIVVAVLELAACDRSQSNIADSLARDPERLVAVLRQCRADASPSDDKVCRAATEAWRRRLFPSDQKHPSPPPQVKSEAPAQSEFEPAPWMGGS
jgi:hypothetical protein